MVSATASKTNSSSSTLTASLLNSDTNHQFVSSSFRKGDAAIPSRKSNSRRNHGHKVKSTLKKQARASSQSKSSDVLKSSVSNLSVATSALKPTIPSESKTGLKVAPLSSSLPTTSSGADGSLNNEPKTTCTVASDVVSSAPNEVSGDLSANQSTSPSIIVSSTATPVSSAPISSHTSPSVPSLTCESSAAAPVPGSRTKSSVVQKSPAVVTVAKPPLAQISPTQVPALPTARRSTNAHVKRSQVSASGDNDVVFVNGQAFNSRGYPVCGVENQRGRRCGRIGTCPFHTMEKIPTIFKRPRTKTEPAAVPVDAAGKVAPENPLTMSSSKNASSTLSAPASASEHQSSSGLVKSASPTARHVPLPPQKSRFKRSWTTEEHRRFLHAMRVHGKGKWKEIAGDVHTRTANQCQSHAQKYFLRQAKSETERKKKSIHDVTDDGIGETYSFPEPQPRPRSPSSKSSFVKSQPVAMPRVHSIPKPIPILPRNQNPIILVPSPDFATHKAADLYTHRIAPASAPLSAALTCLAGNPTQALAAGSTVPIVFPVSSVGNVQYASMVQPFLKAGNTTSAAVVPPPAPMKRRVTVHLNGSARGGKALMLPDDLDKFFKMAKEKLNFKGVFRRVFARSGGQIDSLDEMCPDDVLWLSAGEEFRTPR